MLKFLVGMSSPVLSVIGWKMCNFGSDQGNFWVWVSYLNFGMYIFWSKICSVKTLRNRFCFYVWQNLVHVKIYECKYAFRRTWESKEQEGYLTNSLEFGFWKKKRNLLSLDFVHLFVTKGCIKVKSKWSNPAKYLISEKFARDYHLNVLTLIQALSSPDCHTGCQFQLWTEK